MRTLGPLICVSLLLSTSAFAQKDRAHDPLIVNAKTIYFLNRTGSHTVGVKAVTALKKWNRFQIVTDRNKADLILVLDCDPYRGGNLIHSGGQTGTIEANGEITEDSVPNYTKARPTQYAYLFVIDPATGAKLWGASHPWGGLLTGYNSAGARLIHKLQKQTKQ